MFKFIPWFIDNRNPKIIKLIVLARRTKFDRTTTTSLIHLSLLSTTFTA